MDSTVYSVGVNTNELLFTTIVAGTIACCPSIILFHELHTHSTRYSPSTAAATRVPVHASAVCVWLERHINYKKIITAQANLHENSPTPPIYLLVTEMSGGTAPAMDWLTLHTELWLTRTSQPANQLLGICATCVVCITAADTCMQHTMPSAQYDQAGRLDRETRAFRSSQIGNEAFPRTESINQRVCVCLFGRLNLCKITYFHGL